MDEKIYNKNDKGYKHLLTTKRLFVQLVKSFIKQGWAQKIEPEDINKEADLVYKIQVGKILYE